jgi:fructosamine-3-kinase
MNAAPGGLRAILQDAFTEPPTHVEYLGGGSINQAARVEIGGESYFLKWKSQAPPAFFEVEARGLELLRRAGALRVPQVVRYAQASDGRPAYLALEWIEESRQAESLTFAVNFGRALAAQHRITAPTFGLDHANYIGELPQPNTQRESWATFYRDQRIGAQVEIARQRRRLTPEREKLLGKLMDRLDTLLAGVESAPSLLHGDLWSGNFLISAGSLPVVVDPAVYYGEREVEIAFTELFGGFPPGFLTAYREAYPLERDYEYRRPLYQLYPLLVHLNIFGESYGPSVDSICRRYPP